MQQFCMSCCLVCVLLLFVCVLRRINIRFLLFVWCCSFVMYHVCLLCLPEYFADETSRNIGVIKRLCFHNH